MKLRSLTRNLCKDINLKIVFTSFKITQMFSSKDSIPEMISSNVVYKFSCASCNASYIGETTRHFNTRIKEHFKDKNSHIYKHVNSNENCKRVCNESCFLVIDRTPTEFQLKIKEGLHIEWEKPDLNKRVKHVSSTLL